MMNTRPSYTYGTDKMLILAALLFYSASAFAQNINYATGETAVYGNLNANDFNAISTDDGSSEKISESKDGSGNYRIEWIWHFDIIGTSDSLRLEAQATNTRHGMDFYDFFYRRPGDSEWTPLGTANQTTMTSYTWALDGVNGPVDVKAVDTNPAADNKRANQLWIDYLFIQSAGSNPTPLGAPTDLSAQAMSETEIQLAWTDNATNENRFAIERKSNGGVYSEVASLTADTDSYSDTGLTPLTTYTYRVRAVEGDNPSEYSNEASAITQNSSTGGSGPNTDKVIIGYFPSWAIYNARKYWVSYIPFDRLTHINYAFANVDSNSLQVIIGDTFAEETNTKDPETANGLPAGNLHQLTHFRDYGHDSSAYSHLKIIISVGGWSWSENFSDAALTPESRWRFAESLKNFVQTYNLDGADLDWEYPTGDLNNCGESGNVCRPEDPINHALLIMACRNKLGPDKELSIAMPAGFEIISKIMSPIVDNRLLVDETGDPLVYMRNPDDPGDEYTVSSTTALEMLNYIHIMNYDMVSAYSEENTRHHAPLYGYEGLSGDPASSIPGKEFLSRFNSHYAIQAYRYVHSDYTGFDPYNPVLDPVTGVAVIPASKLTFGVPMYGRGFKSVDSGSWDGYQGLFQFTDDSIRRRTPKGTWDGGKWGNTGVFGYWDLLLNYGGDQEAANNNIWRVSPPASVRPYGPYITTGDLFIGFDDKESLTDKINYLVDQDMAGIMFWDVTGDLSHAQVDQGMNGAAANYPAKSLIHHIAETLENHYQSP